jgi:hypothetical protein
MESAPLQFFKKIKREILGEVQRIRKRPHNLLFNIEERGSFIRNKGIIGAQFLSTGVLNVGRMPIPLFM